MRTGGRRYRFPPKFISPPAGAPTLCGFRSNFLTETIHVKRPDGRIVTLEYNSGLLNRLDRLTAANYGMPINTNLCKNRFVNHEDKTIMLQAASIYTQGDGKSWDANRMFDIMLSIAETSLQMLGRDLWNQINGIS